MVKNEFVYIFSGTKALYETVIKYEINILCQHNKVIVFLEFQDKEIFGLKNLTIIPVFRTSNEKRKMKFIRIIQSSIKLKNSYIDSFKKYCPKILISHSDENFESILAIYLAKFKYKTFIIRRTPSVVINTQLVFIGQKSTPIKNFERLIVRFVHNYVLMFFFTNRVYKSRLLMFPSNESNYNINRLPIHFDLSLCYSETCKFWLSKIGESSNVISLPSLYFRSFHDSKSNTKSVLIVPSNDYLSLMELKNISIDEAAKLEIQNVDKIINVFINQKYDISIKFRSNEELLFFNKFSNFKKNYIIFIEINKDIYSIISNYKILIGFNTTILWRQSLYESNQTLISYQLINHDFYNIFEFNNRINFIKYNSNIDFAVNQILLKQEINYKQTSYPSLKDIVQNILKNG